MGCDRAGDREEAHRRIDELPSHHPFDLRYAQDLPETAWERCAQVLDEHVRDAGREGNGMHRLPGRDGSPGNWFGGPAEPSAAGLLRRLLPHVLPIGPSFRLIVGSFCYNLLFSLVTWRRTKLPNPLWH